MLHSKHCVPGKNLKGRTFLKENVWCTNLLTVQCLICATFSSSRTGGNITETWVKHGKSDLNLERITQKTHSLVVIRLFDALEQEKTVGPIVNAPTTRVWIA
mmetsp:Transcript_18240/g.35605  ORF Transcript_18240/g.35605 Transcript_18240/m.35605 type:complete len:102 (-) Transcript_18240:827-1132(-)